MKNELFSKKRIVILCIILTLCSGTVFLVVSSGLQNNGLDKELAKKELMLQEHASDEVLFSVDGVDVSVKSYEIYKNSIQSSNPNVSDQDIKDRMIERILLKNEAKKRNLAVSDEEMSQYIEIVRIELGKSPELLAYVTELGMSIDQYIEYSKPAYEKFLLIGKLNNELKNEYRKMENNSTGSGNNGISGFDKYYADYKKALIAKAEIIEY